MMFRRFLSPRYTVVALAVALTLLLSNHLTAAQTAPSPAPGSSTTSSGDTPAPSAAGTGDTPAPTGTTASDELTSGADDDSEPGESFLDCSTEIAGDGHCDESNNTEVCAYDGGDCCECTCEATTMNNCGGDYNCIDPDAACVNDDDGNGGTLSVNDDVVETDSPVDVEEETEPTEGDAASGLFNSASFARIITATLAAIGLALY